MKFTSATTLLLLALAPLSSAAVYTWTGANSGDWNDSGNWDANGVPVDTDGGTAALDLDSTNDRLVFNAIGSSNPVPTSNIPLLGGDAFARATQNTPEFDLLHGDLSFVLQGFQNGVVGDSGWNNTIGDDNVGNGTASLTYTSSFNAGLIRDPGGQHTWNVYSDGSLIFNGTNTAMVFSYGTDRFAAINIHGGTVTVQAQLDMLRSNTALGPSYFDLTVAGASVTAEFGTDFALLTDVQSATGDGLTFRSSTALGLSAVDNMDGTFTVTAIPEPSVGILSAGAALLLLRRRRK